MFVANGFLGIIPGLPGGPEVLVILVIGLLLFGGRLPEVGKSLGKSLVEFRKGLRGLKDEVGLDREMQNIRRDLDDASRATAGVTNSWPDDSANPWKDLDDQNSGAAPQDTALHDTATVIDTEGKPVSEQPASETETTSDGPVARGELKDQPADEKKSPPKGDKS